MKLENSRDIEAEVAKFKEHWNELRDAIARRKPGLVCVALEADRVDADFRTKYVYLYLDGGE